MEKHRILKLKSLDSLLNAYENDLPLAAHYPVAMKSIHRLLDQPGVAEVVRGDGSRRRCAEVRAGLYLYRRWLNEDEALFRFATFVWGDCAPGELPEFDFGSCDWDELACPPPRLTTNYDRTLESAASAKRNLLGVASFSDSGGRTGTKVQGASVDAFGKHRRWQDLIGENAPNRKLTEAKVVDIRERYAAGGVSMAKLAKEYGVSQPTISGIVWGSLWIYAPGPVKYRQVMRARCTNKDARYNEYGERTRVEDHPRPEILTEQESAELQSCEEHREEDRYVTFQERRAWSGATPIQYDWGTFYPESSAAERLNEIQAAEATRKRVQTCAKSGKVRHDSKWSASNHLDLLCESRNVVGADTLQAYKCRWCGGWHVGHAA